LRLKDLFSSWKSVIKPEDFITLSPQYTHGSEKNPPIDE